MEPRLRKSVWRRQALAYFGEFVFLERLRSEVVLEKGGNEIKIGHGELYRRSARVVSEHVVRSSSLIKFISGADYTVHHVDAWFF